MFKRFIKTLLVTFIVVSCELNVLAVGDVSNIWRVSNWRDLRSAVEKADNYDCIIMTDNIKLRGNLHINKSVMLDLGGHTLYLGDTNSCIVTGNKVFSHQRTHSEKWPNVHKLFHEGILETEVVDVYKFYDNIKVILQNGTIRHIDGLPGRDGVDNTWSDYNGLDGETPSEVFRVVSGSLKLKDVDVYGGYGGNGGNGGSQKLVHMPFGGGNAGNGGNGGNGGNIVNLTRKQCGVHFCGRTLLVPGQGGKGGQRGNKNYDYWVYSGFKGKDGKFGKNGVNVKKSWKRWHYLFSSDREISIVEN